MMVSLLTAEAGQAEQPPSDSIAGFEKRVLPFLQDHCFECHGEDEQKGDLELHTLDHSHPID